MGHPPFHFEKLPVISNTLQVLDRKKFESQNPKFERNPEHKCPMTKTETSRLRVSVIRISVIGDGFGFRA
jgi:hypothetical protein